MRFSTRARYGLRVCFMLASEEGSIMSLSALVKKTVLSEKYLEQLLGKLRSSGIVKTVRGANGGYYLAKEAKSITINEILKALDDDFALTDCADGTGCKDLGCPNKRIFKRIHDGINDILDNVSLQDMLDDYKDK